MRVLHGFSRQTKSPCTPNNMEASGGHTMTSQLRFPSESPLCCSYILDNRPELLPLWAKPDKMREFSRHKKWLTLNLASVEWWTSSSTQQAAMLDRRYHSRLADLWCLSVVFDDCSGRVRDACAGSVWTVSNQLLCPSNFTQNLWKSTNFCENFTKIAENLQKSTLHLL